MGDARRAARGSPPRTCKETPRIALASLRRLASLLALALAPLAAAVRVD